eukprot:1936063-Prymnesium_polylepis.1
MRVDTLGTKKNISVSIGGRTRWSPAPTAVRMLRFAREPFRTQSSSSSKPTMPTVKRAINPRGHNEPSQMRLR